MKALAPSASRAGYVYLIKPENMPYKIGKSGKPSNRALQLSPALPYAPEVLHVVRVLDMTTAERYFHGQFQRKRLGGEWFALSDEDVEQFRSVSVWPLDTDPEHLKVLLGEDRPAFTASARIGRPPKPEDDKYEARQLKAPKSLWARLDSLVKENRSAFIRDAIEVALRKKEREVKKQEKAGPDVED